MLHLPLLILHISGGALGILSGGTALVFRKGSRRHRIAGDVFVLSMMTMSSAAVYLAIAKSQMTNVFAGLLTFYLVGTAWNTMRRREGERSLLDWSGLVLALAVGAVIMTYGFRVASSPARPKDGVPAGMYFFMSSIALLAAAGDIRMLVRGVSGTKRLVRHLWRMCFALFIASGSLFIARPHLFPAIMSRTGALIFLGVLPLLMLIFWVIRVKFAKAYKRKPSQAGTMNLPAYPARMRTELKAETTVSG